MGTINRRQKEKELRRSAILDAARELFHEKGFRDTTIDDIARATELARGTVYLYFESKEEIYATVLEQGLEILFRMISAAHDATPDPLTKVLDGYEAFLRFHDEFPQYYAVLILNETEIENLIPVAVKARIENRLADLARYIAAGLDAGVAGGVFRPMPTLETAYLHIGVGIGFATVLDRCIRPGIPVNRDVMLSTMRGMIASNLLVAPAR